MLGFTEHTAAGRHLNASQWVPFDVALQRFASGTEPPMIHCATGDGAGGFQVGTEEGMVFVHPESGRVEGRYFPPGVAVSGAIPTVNSPWLKPSTAAVTQARERLITGITQRMRDRVRYAQASLQRRIHLDPVTPTTRLPGGVRALLPDKSFLWVATTEGRDTSRSRILLFHAPSRSWLGWFSVALPVRSMASTDRWLWLGLDASAYPQGNPLIMVDKLPLVSIPKPRWVADAVTAEDLRQRISALPRREQTVFAFFSGDYARVVQLTADQLEAADAEAIFLYAFSHDAVGLDQPATLSAGLDVLLRRHPDSPFAEIARRQRRIESKPPPERTSESGAPTATNTLARRDLDGDGRLNAVELRLWLGAGTDWKRFDADGDGSIAGAELDELLKGLPSAPQ
jgi:hypothetical protein